MIKIAIVTYKVQEDSPDVITALYYDQNLLIWGPAGSETERRIDRFLRFLESMMADLDKSTYTLVDNSVTVDSRPCLMLPQN